ncbi:hypothetical protein HPC49_27930 [Pyxidicoccus fallax]|uniref:Uncharacterized protein n=2 Tax=Pyxidicoccus fallax TaxID=394095 RepID=A0A848LRA4_9BACT|nr:hypothetical protein [Pyxidicoccus fallax]NPC82034.1 hypothetical protein [Pyxidicoccus fallax]
MTPACGALPEPLSRLFDARKTVHVYAPPGAEAAGPTVPVLYLEDGEARFFPGGAANAAHSVVPRPSELVALMQRQDIVIVAVDSEPAAPSPPST